MNETFANLNVCSLAPEQHQRTCGYWYTVTTSWGGPHKAFATERGLYRWLEERGLELSEPLPPRGTFGYQPLKGAYRRRSFMDANEFEHLDGVFTKVLDNAQYTLGILTKEDGVVTVNYLNCNVKTRQVFDYTASREEMS